MVTNDECDLSDVIVIGMQLFSHLTPKIYLHAAGKFSYNS